jgi:hypothetical protein
MSIVDSSPFLSINLFRLQGPVAVAQSLPLTLFEFFSGLQTLLTTCIACRVIRNYITLTLATILPFAFFTTLVSIRHRKAVAAGGVDVIIQVTHS